MTTKIRNQRNAMRSVATIATLVITTFLLSACGGESTETLPNTASSSDSINYTGPTPASDDVQNFKLSVWDNLVQDNRCGSCHGTGGQSPTFVDSENINTAYSQANSVVSLSNPSQSLMVTKVAGGHNCWTSSDAVCADILTTYISNWAGGSSNSAKTIELSAPAIKDPGNTVPFPTDTDDFETYVYTPLLEKYCSDCHGDSGQTPYIASSNIETAYEQSKSRINLATPENSRFVVRLAFDAHNCWSADCQSDAAEMESAILALSAEQELEPVDADLVTSKALVLDNDGLLANAGGRFEDNIIALYEFKAGDGQTAFDTSGVSPALNLTLSGNVDWVGGWGVDMGPAVQTDQGGTVPAGKAQGSTADSRKLHTLLTGTGEYAIEAWVAPGNITQEDARIVTYSGSASTRNMTLSQSLQRYEVLHRSSTSDENTPFATQDGDKLLQATLQHVVVNYSPGTGRQIFVNGQQSGDIDPDDAGLLSEWDNSFALVLGNETDGKSAWQGAIRMVAIHDRALTPSQIQANFEVGVGQKFFLLFSVSELVGLNDSFIVFEVSQFDSFSYRFTSPFFISLDETVEPSNIPLQGMRLGINGKEATVGQAWANLDLVLDSEFYEPGTGQPLSRLGTIIALENGPESDEFFLTFDRLGSEEYSRTEPVLPQTASPADLPASSSIGLKTFDEINESMARMTGVSKTQAAVTSTFNTVKQQLPTIENIDGFLSSHQMAVTQMAIQYCDALISDGQARADFFPGFNFSAPPATAFEHGGKSLITDRLLERFVGVNLSTQPTALEVETEVGDLIAKLSDCGVDGCAEDRTETIVKASCAAVLGSATTLVQ
ncbi:LamG domain-containing protein [Marinobacter sp. 1_MG-2023]|uniref:LamG domain-containing protein n=1 Tax=Marinobacter sp. 1_MG-2023 TaxID=3062627 RepID=UPI0026E2459C|nr:LamG domain-containing protein [Marinobacter sp. 1_MG-2023]MDO6823462.1 LamG domain-containing protein [Marinobacter sp. 1_MG-2023]